MRRVIPISAVLLTAAATLSAQTGAWLGQPMTAWNQPAAAVPASGIGAVRRRRSNAAAARPPRGAAVSSDALRRARWVTFRHLDQSLEKGDVEVIGGMTGATPGCEPTLFNLFVFAGGRFAGTVSPTRDDAVARRCRGRGSHHRRRHDDGGVRALYAGRRRVLSLVAGAGELQDRADRCRPDAGRNRHPTSALK